MGARIIAVLDTNQAIYGFRSAGDGDVTFAQIAETLGRSRPVEHLLLPRNYRCDWSIAELTRRKWIPEFEGVSQARGDVDHLTFAQAADRLTNLPTDIERPDGIDGAIRKIGTEKNPVSFCVLCRTNAPLVTMAYFLIGQGKRVLILGRDHEATTFKNIVKEICEEGKVFRITGEGGFIEALREYYKKKAAKYTAPEDEKKLDALNQNVQCLQIITDRAKDDTIDSIIREIDNLFAKEPSKGVITFSTIHRSKGKEWDVCFILKPDLMPHPSAKSEKELKQERNMQYVGCTRARNRHYFISDYPFGPRPGPCSYDHYPTTEEMTGVPMPPQPAAQYVPPVPKSLPPMPVQVVQQPVQAAVVPPVRSEPPKPAVQPKPSRKGRHDENWPVEDDGLPF